MGDYTQFPSLLVIKSSNHLWNLTCKFIKSPKNWPISIKMPIFSYISYLCSCLFSYHNSYLSIHLLIILSIYPSNQYASINLKLCPLFESMYHICLSIYPSFHPSIYLPIYLYEIYLFIYLSKIYLSIHQSIYIDYMYLSIYLLQIHSSLSICSSFIKRYLHLLTLPIKVQLFAVPMYFGFTDLLFFNNIWQLLRLHSARLRGSHPRCGVRPRSLHLGVNANHLPRLRGLTRLLCSSKFVGFRPCMRGLTPLFCCWVNRKPGLPPQCMELFHVKRAKFRTSACSVCPPPPPTQNIVGTHACPKNIKKGSLSDLRRQRRQPCLWGLLREQVHWVNAGQWNFTRRIWPTSRVRPRNPGTV